MDGSQFLYGYLHHLRSNGVVSELFRMRSEREVGIFVSECLQGRASPVFPVETVSVTTTSDDGGGHKCGGMVDGLEVAPAAYLSDLSSITTSTTMEECNEASQRKKQSSQSEQVVGHFKDKGEDDDSSARKPVRGTKMKGRRRWTREERFAVQMGVKTVGNGDWVGIKRKYSALLADRTTVNIKDCARQLRIEERRAKKKQEEKSAKTKG